MKITEIYQCLLFIFFPETRDIRININDINDNKPEFAKDFYTFNVAENTDKGTSVFKLTATDADDSSGKECQMFSSIFEFFVFCCSMEYVLFNDLFLS